jgi:hypothetical protein
MFYGCIYFSIKITAQFFSLLVLFACFFVLFYSVNSLFLSYEINYDNISLIQLTIRPLSCRSN